MDLLASRAAQGAKTKGVKKPTKNELKQKKEKIIAKVDSTALSKSLKKKNSKKNIKETTDLKKELIKKSITETGDIKLVKLLKEIPSNVLKSKNKKDNSKLEKANENVVKTRSNKALKNNIKETKSVSQVVSNFSAVNKLDKKQKINKKKLDTLKQNKSNSIEINVVKSDKTKENIKLTKKLEKQQRAKSKMLVTNEQENSNLSKVLKNNSVKENIKQTKQENKKKVAKSMDSKENKILDKKLKNKKISVDEAKDKSLTSQSKKLKTESEKLLSVENNQEIKNIKSKKRKLQETDKSDELKNQFPTRKEIAKYVKALLKVIEIHEQKKNNLFSSEKPPINMQITCIKIPKTPLHQMRIILPHSLVTSTDDVALFVKDLKKGRRRDPEDTINHYQDILQQHGCTQIKTVIPLNQVKTEFRPFEMRRRLISSYDYFLVDGCIAGHMAHLLGKAFREKRKLPTSVHMTKKDLKAEINAALKKTCLQIHSDGNTSNVTIGSCSMSEEKIVDNIMATIESLSQDYPGGLDNIRSLRIKTPRSIAIPIYVTLKSKNDVKVPEVQPKRPKAYKEVEGELSTFNSNTNVTVLPDGTVRVVRTGGADSDEETNNKDEEMKAEKQNNETKTVDKNKEKVKAEVNEEDNNKDKKKIDNKKSKLKIKVLNKKKLKFDKIKGKKDCAPAEIVLFNNEVE